MPFKHNQNLIGRHHILGICPRNLTRLCAPNCFLVKGAGGLGRTLPIPLMKLLLARLWPLDGHDACTGRFPVATSPSMKMMEKKEYQLKVREHSRNMQILSSRQASTNRLQEIRPRNAILIVMTPSAAQFSVISTFHNRDLLYRIIRTAPGSTLCTCLTFRPQPTLG